MNKTNKPADPAPKPGDGANANAEVLEKPRRRRYTAQYKLRVLEEVDRAANGEKGAILRREGLYSSHVAEWRKARRLGALGALDQKRGRKTNEVNPLGKKVMQLERENVRLREELRRARVIIDVQGKVAGLLDTILDSGKHS